VEAIIQGITIVGGSVLIALAGMLIVRRWVPFEVLVEQNEVAGFLIAVLGVAYAVLLALVLLTVWEQFEAAQSTVAREANALAGMYRIAQGLPNPAGSRMLALSEEYAHAVIDEEWITMGRGLQSTHSPHAWRAFDQIWSEARSIDVHTPREQALYGELLTELNRLGDERKLRLLAAREGVPQLMWVVLLVGGILTVAFTYFFGVKSMRSQALMTAALAGTIALNLFLIAAIEYPFTGGLRVSPEAFQQATEVFERLQPHSSTNAER
jgi:hypothetical protein